MYYEGISQLCSSTQLITYEWLVKVHLNDRKQTMQALHYFCGYLNVMHLTPVSPLLYEAYDEQSTNIYIANICEALTELVY